MCYEMNLRRVPSETLRRKNNGRIQGKFYWGLVGGADIAAGVAAGVVTSTALVVPFIGWGAWAAATAGAALITSGGAALIMVLR